MTDHTIIHEGRDYYGDPYRVSLWDDYDDPGLGDGGIEAARKAPIALVLQEAVAGARAERVEHAYTFDQARELRDALDRAVERGLEQP